MWQSAKHFVNTRPLLLCITLYFFLRCINLTLLPMFNDEAIYLDWGWREIHTPSYLFYSLYDSKQPFLMWLFGLAQSILPDPLFAGRVISVLFGFGTLVGIYQIAKQYFSARSAVLSALLYICIPIFSFYDRQALMESAIGMVSVWAIFWLLKYFQKPNQLQAVLLGISFALGFWIKSSVVILMLSAVFLFIIHTLKSKEKYDSVVLAVISTLIFFICMAPLFLQQKFWSTFSANGRYSLTLTELFHFPFGIWFTNLWYNLQILFFFVTPFVLAVSIVGIIIAFRKKSSTTFYLALWIVCTLLLQTFLVRSTSQRYLVSYLPILSVFAAAGGEYLYQKYHAFKYLILLALFSLPLFMTIMQLFAPITSIQKMRQMTPLSQEEYVKGYTSGIGIQETIDYLTKKANNQPVIVAVAENTGNPESALFTYFVQSPTIKIIYFDARLMGDAVNTYDCIDSPLPMYFISRDNYTAGVIKFFTLEKKIKNPFSPYYIGIYALNTHCTGKKLNITFHD